MDVPLLWSAGQSQTLLDQLQVDMTIPGEDMSEEPAELVLAEDLERDRLRLSGWR